MADEALELGEISSDWHAHMDKMTEVGFLTIARRPRHVAGGRPTEPRPSA
ncbi:hypothetical protein ACQEVF_46200 [Nonomuraea polychroma]